MTPLALGLLLTAPAQPPVGPPPFPVQPIARRQFPPAPPPPVVLRPPANYPPVVAYPPVNYPPVVQPPVNFPPAGPPVLTLAEFSRSFTPTPGKHHVWLVHPCTCQPVAVCFTLPNCGKLKRFEVNKRSIEFEFDRPDFEVEIIFRTNGRVDVKYDD